MYFITRNVIALQYAKINLPWVIIVPIVTFPNSNKEIDIFAKAVIEFIWFIFFGRNGSSKSLLFTVLIGLLWFRLLR